VDGAREHQEGGTRGVDDRPFRGSNEVGIRIQHVLLAEIDDHLRCAKMLRHLGGLAPFVERGVLHRDRVGRDWLSAIEAALGTCERDHDARIDAAG
jgi:hypothetical protein